MSQDQNNVANIVRPAYPFDLEGPIDLSSLNGKTILITGGASGFGEGFFRKWAEHGTHKFISVQNLARFNLS